MKHQFVKTKNYERFMKAFRSVEERGAREAGMLFVEGQPGAGKTETVQGVAAQNGWVFLRANVDWTPRYFLGELARELSVDTAGRSGDLFKRCLMQLAKRDFPAIVVDEVQHCLGNRAAILEKIRDFSDRTNSPVILVAGENGAWERLGRFPQLASRIASHIKFELADDNDIAAVFKQLCEVPVSADLVSRVKKDSKGLMRLVMNAIPAVERIASTNGLKTVTAKDADGVPLCVDWQATRTPLYGRA